MEGLDCTTCCCIQHPQPEAAQLVKPWDSVHRSSIGGCQPTCIFSKFHAQGDKCLTWKQVLHPDTFWNSSFHPHTQSCWSHVGHVRIEYPSPQTISCSNQTISSFLDSFDWFMSPCITICLIKPSNTTGGCCLLLNLITWQIFSSGSFAAVPQECKSRLTPSNPKKGSKVESYYIKPYSN